MNGLITEFRGFGRPTPHGWPEGHPYMSLRTAQCWSALRHRKYISRTPGLTGFAVLDDALCTTHCPADV